MVRTKINVCEPPPIYKSTTVDINDDGTYRVKHVFVNYENKDIIVEYPRVQLCINHSIDFELTKSQVENVFPRFNVVKVLADVDGSHFLQCVSIKQRTIK